MEPQDYIAPECPLDLPAILRDNILTDVECFGEIERCSQQMSSAFSGWDHAQIDQWCAEHNLVIIAHYDGRIVIKPGSTRPLTELRAELQAENSARIRAEVEAMDWPEVIDG